MQNSTVTIVHLTVRRQQTIYYDKLTFLKNCEKVMTTLNNGRNNFPKTSDKQRSVY